MWYLVTSGDESWFPPKDLDFKYTEAYSGTRSGKYALFYYYSAITLMGSEILPTDSLELLVATILVFVGTIFIGVVIGEFASILEAMSRKERMKSEEMDIISTVMVNLRLPEPMQDRVLEYYDNMNQATYINNMQVYESLSPALADEIKLFQMRSSFSKLPFLNIQNRHQVEMFCRNMEISFFMPGDIIVKQGTKNEHLF